MLHVTNCTASAATAAAAASDVSAAAVGSAIATAAAVAVATAAASPPTPCPTPSFATRNLVSACVPDLLAALYHCQGRAVGREKEEDEMDLRRHGDGYAQGSDCAENVKTP